MAGTAGSKFGIINDEVPLKKSGANDIEKNQDDQKDGLRDLCSIVRIRMSRKKTIHYQDQST